MNDNLMSPNCPKRRDSNFTRLTAGDLPFWQAVRLRQHLRACPECAAAFAETEAIFTQMRAIHTGTAASGDLRSRTWAQIETNALAYQPRRSRPALILSLAASGAALATVAAILLLAPGTPIRPIPAFAEVERAMSQAQSVEFTTVTTTPIPSGRTLTSTISFAGCLNPPMAVVKNKSHSRETLIYCGLDSNHDCDTRTRSSQTVCYVRSPFPRTELLQYIREFLAFSTEPQLLRPNTVWSTGFHTSLNGKDVLQFDGHWKSTSSEDFVGGYQTVWVDPQSLRFVRIVSIPLHRPQDEGCEAISSHFVYDRPHLSEKMETAPPVGKPLVLTSEDYSPPSKQQIRRVNAVMQPALAACQSGNWEAFSALCDGGEQESPKSAQARRLHPVDTDMGLSALRQIVELRSGVGTKGIQQVRLAARYTMTRHSESERLPNVLTPNCYRVKAGRLCFYLRQDSDNTLQIFRVTSSEKAGEAY